MTPRVALPFLRGCPSDTPSKGQVCCSFFFYIILTKYWDVESKNLDAYEILDEGALAAFKRVEVKGFLRSFNK